MSQPPIPLVDLQAAHAEVAEEVDLGFKRVLAATAFIGGEDVAAFEREYAAFCSLDHCVALANGTDAVELALRAVGVGPDHEVIIPANTFVATAEAVARTGASVVVVDIDPVTYLMDIPAALAAITPATRAIVPVHLYGQLAPVAELRATLAGRDIAIVEDAAQCQGATRGRRPAGADGIAATSFYPGKNLGAYGDAGAVTTSRADLATAIRRLANHGGLTKYVHDVVGMNSRLDSLQAVVLRAKLARLTAWNEARRAAAARYDAMLESVDVIRPVTLDGNEHVWHLYVVRIPGGGSPTRRNAALARLNAAGIGAGVHYPVPIHRTPAFVGVARRSGPLVHVERAADEILSLPIYPQITHHQQAVVVQALADALE